MPLVEPWDYAHKDGNNSVSHVGRSSMASAPGVQNAQQPANTMKGFWQYVGALGKNVNTVSVNVTTAFVGNSISLALYKCKPASAHDLYPTDLLGDFGSISMATTGAKIWTVNLVLPQGGYWWVTNVAVAGGNLELEGGVVGLDATMPAPFGRAVNSSGNAGAKTLSLSQAFGAAPNPFPAGAALSINVPVYFLQQVQ